jgi:N-methylhydantoinase A
VTDANVALGRIDPAGTLAGTLSIQSALAERALGTVGEELVLTVTETALGIVTVVEEVMAGAIRAVSIEQGADPRDGILVAFGGAGGLHATALARRLDMAGVVMPPFAGIFSAVGLLLSPPRTDAARSVRVEDDARLDIEIGRVKRESRQHLADSDVHAEITSGFADVRYRGQAHETAVPYEPGEGWEALLDRFHLMHLERNGFARRGDPVEVVTVRAESVGRPRMSWADLPEWSPVGDVDRPTRPVTSDRGDVQARVVNRPALAPGDEVVGPAIIEEAEATTFLASGERGVVHPSGALEIEW